MNRGKLLFEKLVNKLKQISSATLDNPAVDRTAALETATGNKDREIDEQMLHDIHAVIDKRAVIQGIRARDEEFVELEVVGESFYAGAISYLAANKPGSEAGWFSGFLLPEPTNKYDKNAIAVYFIDTRTSDFRVAQVGYLKSDVAAKLGPVITKKADEDGEIIPLLGRIFGGEPGKVNYGVSARAFWDFK